MREPNELHMAERDESRSGRRSLTELDRAAMCDYPIRPCNCGTCDMRSELWG